MNPVHVSGSIIIFLILYESLAPYIDIFLSLIHCLSLAGFHNNRLDMLLPALPDLIQIPFETSCNKQITSFCKGCYAAGRTSCQRKDLVLF